MDKTIEVELLRRAEEKKHIHLNIEILYALDASVEVWIGDKRFVLKKGDIFLINSNILHSVCLQSGTLACRFTLDYRSLSELLKRPTILYRCNSVGEDFAAYRRLSEILDSLIQAVLVGPGSSYMKLSLYYQLVDCLEGEFVISDRDRSDVHVAEDIIQYISMNYWKPLTLQEAADFMHMSYSAFSKYFKKISGMTFLEYLNNVRMHFAVEELLYTDHSITRIAVEQGFSNPSVFNKNFKNSFHMTPTEYRTKYAPAQEHADMQEKRQNGMLEQYFAARKQHGGSQETMHVYADSSIRRKCGKVWNQAINVGSASNAYSSEMQRQMECAKELLGISYVRICNMFDWDMKIRQGHEVRNLNFAYVDRVLDTIADLGLIPFIELGDKTKSINYSVHKIWEEDREDVFLELTEFTAVLDAFLEHVLHRYGSGAINRWMFELWFNDRKYEREKTLGELKYDYALAFEQAAAVVKKYAPDSLIGGTGIAMRKVHRQLEELMPRWRHRKHPPDFISLYAYPYLNAAQNEGDEQIAYSSRAGFMKDQIMEYQACARKWGLEDVPLFLTECNSSLSQRNFYNDSNAKASLLLKNMIDCMEDVAVGMYNPLSDLESVYYDFVEPFSGATGLLSKEGIVKPVFYAVKFMNELGDCLIDRGDGYVITGDGRDCFQILCCNYKPFNQKFFLKEEYEIGMEMLDDIFVDSQPRNLHFVLKKLKDRAYVIKTYKVNLNYANVLNSWKELGQDVPDREEGQYLRAVCLPKLTKRRQQTENGCLHLQETLDAHEIRMIKIEPSRIE